MSDATKNINAEKIQGNLAVNSLSAFTTTTTTNFRMISGATDGYVLTSDANGNARWAAPTVSSGGTSVDTFVTGFTFTNNNTLTISRNQGLNDLPVTINNLTLTGLTVNGSISATTYLGLPPFITGFTDTFVTGFTYNDANRLTISRNQGLPDLIQYINTFSGLTVNGNVLVNGVLSATTIYNTSGNSILNNITANTMYVNWIDFNENAVVPTANGRISWDSGTGSLNIGVGDSTTGTIDLQVGQEELVRVHNSEGDTLTKGTVVYVSGSVGNRPAVKRAIATSDGYSVTTLGVVAGNITTGAEGYVTTFGIISNLNTIGLTGGTAIWLSPYSAGTYTEIKPIAPQHTVLIGYVVRISPTVGSIFVNISNGWELDELHDVRISGATVGDLLVRSTYNGSNVWVNSKTLHGNYLIDGNLNVTGTTTTNVLSATTIHANTIDVSGKISTVNFQITSGATEGYVLTAIDNNGNAAWRPVSGGTEGGGGGTFTGNTSASCITDLYITNLYGCSPITIHDSVKNVGSTSTGILSLAFGEQAAASGNYSHAEGLLGMSIGNYSHAEGSNTQAIGDRSHAEGDSTITLGVNSHAEGSTTRAGVYAYTIDPASVGGVIDLDSSYGDVSAEFTVGSYAFIGSSSITKFLIFDSLFLGGKTTVKVIGTPSEYGYISPYGVFSASGADQIQGGQYSHAEGSNTQSIGEYSHAEGSNTQSIGSYSHAEGRGTQSIGIGSHAEGKDNLTIGEYSHAEGENNLTIGNYSHAEGFETKSIGTYSHTEGQQTYGGSYAYTIDSTSGTDITLNSLYGNVVDQFTGFTNVVLTDNGSTEFLSIVTAIWDSTNTIVTLDPAPSVSWDYVVIIDNPQPTLADVVIGGYSHTEGYNTITINPYSHAEGNLSKAIAQFSHAEGYNTKTLGDYSHSQGSETTAKGNYSFASGSGSTAQGLASFVHSTGSIVTGDHSVVLGGSGISGTSNNFVYVSNLNINSVPVSNSGATQVLVRNSSTGDVEYRDSSTIGGSSFTQQDELDLALITSFRFLTGN